MTKINPINILTKGTVNRLSVQVNSFQLFPTYGVVLYYTLSGDGGVFLDGNIQVPQDVVDQWATDDTIILDYALNHLGVTIDTTPDPEPEQELDPE